MCAFCTLHVLASFPDLAREPGNEAMHVPDEAK